EGRRPDDAPRFGDVPPPPEGPRPGYRFPLPESVDPAEAVPRPPLADEYDSGPPTRQVEMPHWTDPPSGEVPRILVGEEGEDDDLGAWAGISGANRGPRWRDSAADWEDADFEDDSFDDDEVRMGALDVNRTEHSDLFSFDEPEPAYAEPEPEPAPEPRTVSTTTSIRTRPAPDYGNGGGNGGRVGGGRDMGTAVGIGLALGALCMLAFKAGPLTAMVLTLLVIVFAAGEVFDVLRRAGYRPATLLGLTATVSILLAAYNKGETAVPLVLALTVVFSFLWYLFDVVKARPTINVAATLFGFMWVGFLGSFAALLLALPARHGVVSLFGAIVCTVGYDVGGLFFGSQMGSRPLMPEVSPNKTVEGLLGGCLTAIVVGAIFGALSHFWGMKHGVALGVVVAIMAPLGDLAESMIKRDVGIKDMGRILPGHGGVLDRFDALLFVLPATYYLVKLLKLG
ncbi:MAG TPA: phosphatidate cytidylyltransferase, partial [Acidimicrobiales bacterium]|nr:phosphatidate cytidylyltransferase [Acidimicrobiales bacterium]